MDAWEHHHHLYGNSPHAYQFNEERKAIRCWEQQPSSYMLQEPLIEAVRIFGLLSALKNEVEWQFTN
jgi:hypothetical protein